MLDYLLEGMNSKAFNRWFSMLIPSLSFWTVGLFAVTWPIQDGLFWEVYIIQKPTIIQVFLLSGVVLLILISIMIVQSVELSVLRFLYGHWPSWLQFLLQLVIDKYHNNIKIKYSRWHELQRKRERLSPAEFVELGKLDNLLRTIPLNDDRWLPTRLGNILRAAEEEPLNKYGLHLTVCWPRLWLVLPEESRVALSMARSTLNENARLWVWSILIMVWAMWVWWLFPVGLMLAAFIYYFRLLESAEIYGNLIKSIFDVYHMIFFKAFRWPLPTNPSETSGIGKQLTEYLGRGSDSIEPTFTGEHF